MRMLQWLVIMLMINTAVAQESDGLRLIQARVDGQRIEAWLDMPTARLLDAAQFSATVGAVEAQVTTITDVATSDDGVAYVFLVDISRSLSTKQFAQIQDALRQWIQSMGERDRAAVLTIGKTVVKRSDFTADRDRLLTTIDGLAPVDLETSFYQGVLEAISLGRRQDDGLPARRAIVVLSDGIDDSVAGATLDEVFRQSREFRVPIYSIGFAASPINDAKRQGLKTLGTLARQSGGYFVQANAGAIDEAYRRQREHIRSAYRVAIACPDCVVDGQLARLNLVWRDGQTLLNDGLDIRLLADSASRRAGGDEVSERVPPYLMGLAAAVLLLLVAKVWLVWDRLRSRPEIETTELPTPPLVVKHAPAGDAMQWVVVAGVEKGKVYRAVIQTQQSIGRAPDCDLTIADDTEISARHALLIKDDKGFRIRDLHSTNGTWVNGVPVHNDFPIRDGDLVLLGRTELRFKAPQAKP